MQRWWAADWSIYPRSLAELVFISVPGVAWSWCPPQFRVHCAITLWSQWVTADSKSIGLVKNYMYTLRGLNSDVWSYASSKQQHILLMRNALRRSTTWPPLCDFSGGAHRLSSWCPYNLVHSRELMRYLSLKPWGSPHPYVMTIIYQSIQNGHNACTAITPTNESV